MADPGDMILPLLRDMRAENVESHRRTSERLDKIESTLESYRHALTAESLLSKLVTRDFEERIEARERKVRQLESHK